MWCIFVIFPHPALFAPAGLLQVDESRALKLMKLDALRQELAMHEQTVVDLGHIINGMERDLGLC